ncbi:MAG: hypothetical protein ACOWWM_14710 [Desulfobacterales bacterium]
MSDQPKDPRNNTGWNPECGGELSSAPPENHAIADATYRLVFTGRIREGLHIDDVKSRTAILFKLPKGVVDELFSGEEQVVKRGGTLEVCEKLQARLETVGAVTRIEEERRKVLEPRLTHPFHRFRIASGGGTPSR